MNEETKNILIISAWLPGGGVETVITNFSRIFSSRGYNVQVLVLSNVLEWNWFDNKEFKITFYPVFKKESELNIFYTLKSYSNIFKIIKNEIDNFSPSNIFITHTILGLFIYQLKRINNGRYLYWPMNNLFRPILKHKISNLFFFWIKKHYMKFLTKEFNASICISGQIKKELEYLGKSPSYITYAPINSQLSNSLNSTPTIPHFIFVGRIDERKNLPFLLKALATIKQKDWKLDIVGDGPEKEKASELSFALGIHENINWLGLRFPPFGKQLDYTALFMTSLSEGFPIVVIDALLFGIPVICSSHLSIYNDAIVEGINGLGYKQNSITSLTEIINNLYSNKYLFNAKEISERCIDNFGDDKYFKRLSKILNGKPFISK